MQITPDIYHRFLNGQCSEEEQQYCMQYFQEHPDELELVMNSMAWDQFTPNMSLPAAITGQMRQGIRQRINKRRLAAVMKRVLAAAVVIGAIILFMYKPAKVPIPGIVQQLDTVVYNRTAASIHITLNDQSVVVLYPGSELKYRKLFDKRDLYLQGDARFEVHTDKQRPFTVYASGVATTALGTSFRVTAKPGKAVQVKLFTSKVVVQAAKKATWTPVYLQPGQQFRLVDTSISVTRFKQAHHPPNTKRTQPAIQTKKTNALALAFDKQPLEEVIQRLQSRYPIKVHYKKQDIQDVLVTATFDENDSPQTILDLLCTLNYLSLTTENGDFVITR